MGQVVSRVTALFLMIGLCLSLFLANKKHTTLVCKDIAIAIQNNPEQSFITPKEILDLLQSTDKIPLLNRPLNNINTYAIQDQVKNHPLIKNVLVYKTWSGTLKICLTTKCLIARIISLMEPNGSQIYLDEKGDLIEASGLPLLRLLVITDTNIAIENRKLGNKGLLALLHYIYQDAFWRRQITSLQVEANGKIILGTQLGGHQVTFGKAENIDEKFKRLGLFYSQVIPYKGWKAYHRVNVEFEDQLICE